MSDETGINADVIYIGADGKVLIERPGLDPILVIVDAEQAAAQEAVPDSAPTAPRTVMAPAVVAPTPVRFKPRPGRVFVISPESLPIVEAPPSAADRSEPAGAGES